MRERRRRIPRGFWACFVIATVNAAIWAVVTPTFQVPDEPAHFGYVQWFAETGRIPRPIDTRPGAFFLSQEEETVLKAVPFNYAGTPGWDPQRDRTLQQQLSQGLDRKREVGAGAAAPYPPLYYVLEAIPYKVFSGSSLLDRLLAMRLFSALFAGFTAGFCFLFVRELLPRSRWAPLIAGVAVALQPLVAFVSGGVNPEAQLYAASAAVFYTVARAFRRGLTIRGALAIGAALTVALLSKGTALGLVPGVVVALALLVWRMPRTERVRGLRDAAAAALVGGLPFLAWLAFGRAVYDRPTSTATAGLAHARVDTGVKVQLNYIWQLYLPRLPFMNRLLPFSVPRVIWFDGFVGRFGYNQYNFPGWFNQVAAVIAVCLAGLGGFTLVRARRLLRRRWAEVVSYLALVGGILLSVGIGVYRLSPFGQPIAQARYLLPALAVYAVIVAFAARAPGRRYGPVLAASLAVVFAAHDFAAIMLTLGRYYT